jgi:hypothetical protein
MNEKELVIFTREDLELLVDQVRNFQAKATYTKDVDGNNISDLIGWLHYQLIVAPREQNEKERRLQTK